MGKKNYHMSSRNSGVLNEKQYKENKKKMKKIQENKDNWKGGTKKCLTEK